jgi:hypothetical protein
MIMEHWWNGAERENPRQLEKTVFQCCSIHKKFHMDCTGHEIRASIIYATFNPKHFSFRLIFINLPMSLAHKPHRFPENIAGWVYLSETKKNPIH